MSSPTEIGAVRIDFVLTEMLHTGDPVHGWAVIFNVDQPSCTAHQLLSAYKPRMVSFELVHNLDKLDHYC